MKTLIPIPQPVYNTDLYAVWASMVARCENPNNPEYPRYGARGIAVCAEWRASFRNFKADMEPTYAKGLSIERADNSKGYYKENCTWATVREQARNRRTNKNLTLNEETKTMIEWCEQYDRDYNSVQLRIQRGWTAEKALAIRTNKPYKDVQLIAKERADRKKPVTLPPCE